VESASFAIPIPVPLDIYRKAVRFAAPQKGLPKAEPRVETDASILKGALTKFPDTAPPDVSIARDGL
jgi:hypothetical protein